MASSFWQRFKLAWRVLMGQAVMYRVKVPGLFELDVEQGAHFVECEFRPSSWRMMVGEKREAEDGC